MRRKSFCHDSIKILSWNFRKMISVPRECRCCQECERKTNGEFKKVIDLKASGLSIYVHNDTNNMVEKQSCVEQDEIFILYNPNEKIIKRYDYISELSKFMTKCYQCKALIQKTRLAITEISDINANEIKTICQHCKRANPAGKCKRCEFIANRFFCNRVKQFEDRQIRIEVWLCKVRALLQAILDKNILCKHKLHQKSCSIDEFEKLLKEVDTPLPMYESEIEEIESSRIHRNNLMKETKDMLENFLTKLRTQKADRLYSSDESLYVSSSVVTTSCACKYLMDKKFEDKRLKSLTTEGIDARVESVTKTNGDEIFMTKKGSGFKEWSGKRLTKTGASRESNHEGPDKPGIKKSLKGDAASKRVVSSKKTDDKKKLKAKSSGDDKMNINQPTKGSDSLDKSLKAHILEHVKQKKQKSLLDKRGQLDVVNIKLPKIDDLPIPKPAEIIEIKVSSQSCVELDKIGRVVGPEEIIKGIKIVPFDPHYKGEKMVQIEPLLFKTNPSYYPTITEATGDSPLTDVTQINTRKQLNSISNFGTGVVKYQLSNREFINKGWTKLPTAKVMKRMNIYKMIPAKLNNNWFSRNNGKEIMLYNTGEKLAEITSSTRGSWYYKNGSIALDYYPAEEVNAGQRVVVYSNTCEEDGDLEKAISVTVLASFDFSGNGVVYDHYGNVRLKYNQSEGIIIDDKIGPRSRWKWHTLNDPPALEPVFIDTLSKHRDPRIEELLLAQKYNQNDGHSLGKKNQEQEHQEEKNRDMIAIELDNCVREKAHKMLQRFKPFQIRMKALKINTHFSLRIVDQANIYLLYSDGPISMKLDLGMLLISNEIIDTDTVGASEVATSYDKVPARSRSLANIQDILKRARKRGKGKSVTSIFKT